MVYNGKPYSNGWFGGTTIFGNIHLLLLLGANIYCIPAEFLQTGLISLDRSWCPLQVVRRQNLCSWISPKYYLLWRIVPPYVKMLEIYMVYRRYIWYIEGIYDISPLNSPPPNIFNHITVSHGEKALPGACLTDLIPILLLFGFHQSSWQTWVVPLPNGLNCLINGGHILTTSRDPITLSKDDWGVWSAKYLGFITILTRWVLGQRPLRWHGNNAMDHPLWVL